MYAFLLSNSDFLSFYYVADTFLGAGDASSSSFRIFLGTVTWVEEDTTGLNGKCTGLLIFT